MPELEFAARAVRPLVLVDVTRVCNQPSAWSWSERCGDLDIGREFQPARTDHVATLHHARLSQRLQSHAQRQVADIARRFKAIHASRRSTSGREQDDHSTLMSVCSKGAAHRPDRNRRRVIYLTMELLLNPAKHEAAA